MEKFVIGPSFMVWLVDSMSIVGVGFSEFRSINIFRDIFMFASIFLFLGMPKKPLCFFASSSNYQIEQ